MNKHEYVSPKVAADRLGISVDTVLRWVREGRLEALRCGPKFVRLPWEGTLEALKVGSAQKRPGPTTQTTSGGRRHVS